jgi:hypothetical protein
MEDIEFLKHNRDDARNFILEWDAKAKPAKHIAFIAFARGSAETFAGG